MEVQSPICVRIRSRRWLDGQIVHGWCRGVSRSAFGEYRIFGTGPYIAFGSEIFGPYILWVGLTEDSYSSAVLEISIDHNSDTALVSEWWAPRFPSLCSSRRESCGREKVVANVLSISWTTEESTQSKSVTMPVGSADWAISRIAERLLLTWMAATWAVRDVKM